MSKSKEGEERADIKHCQEPSDQYYSLLEECGDDPRSVAGFLALLSKGWAPAVDARDARVTAPFSKKNRKK